MGRSEIGPALPGPVIEAANTLWSFMSTVEPPSPADLAILLGSRDLFIAAFAADIIEKGLCDFIVCSGGIAHQSDFLETGWVQPEGEVFAEELARLGVPREKIVVERRARNTAENLVYSIEAARQMGLATGSLLLVHKPFMALRTRLTAEKLLPAHGFLVTGPPLSFADYCSRVDDVARLTNILAGDFERIYVYAAKGFIAPIDIPATALAALAILRQAGFKGHSVLG